MLDINVILILIFTLLLGVLFVQIFGVTRRDDTPPGPWGVPVLGHLPFLGMSLPKTFAKWRKKYGDIFKIKLGSWDTIVINGIDTIQEAAEFDNDAFSDRPDFASFSVPRECGDNVDHITCSPFSDTYIQFRKQVTLAFRAVSNPNTSPVCEMISTEAEKLCETLLKNGEHNEPISLDSDVMLSVSSVMYRLIYGDDVERNPHEVTERIEAADRFDRFAMSGSVLDVMPWLRVIMPGNIKTLRDIYMSFVNMDKRVVSHRKEGYHDESITSVLDYIMRMEQQRGSTFDGGHMSKCFYSSLGSMFMAGQGASATTLSWAVLYMTAFPQIQEQVQREIDQLTDSSRAVNWDDRANLPYTMATMNEIQRITNTVPFGLPHATTKDISFKGFHIDKGTPVLFNLSSDNLDERTWGDPELFRPGRFLTSDGQLDQAKCKLIALFGFGRRKCPGARIAVMQTFGMFTTLMQRCTFTKPENEVLNLTPEPGILYKPKKFLVHVQDRMAH